MVRLRQLAEQDIAHIKRWPPYRDDREQMDYALREKGWLDEFYGRPDAFLFAAENGPEIVGFTILAMGGTKEAEFRIALRADQAGRGLGEQIARETLQLGFGEYGLSRIHLIVRKNNARAIRLYRRIGFADRGECRREIRGQTVEFWKMELDREHFSQLQIKILSKGQEFFSQGRRVRRERQKKRSANSLGFVLNSVVSACSARDDFASGSGLSGLGECGTDRRKEIVMTGPKRRALIVIDAQNDYVHGNLPIEYPPIELSLDNIGRAMDGAKSASIPIVAVQNMNPATAPFMALGTRGADLHEVVASRGWDHFVSKNMPSAFKGTDLENWLRERAIDTITVAGFMTHNCDLSTVLQAFHIGINVEVLADATGSLPYANRAGKATAEEIHRVMLVVMQSRFAAVMSVDEWLHAIATGVEPERDTIFSSNQRARRQ